MILDDLIWIRMCTIFGNIYLANDFYDECCLDSVDQKSLWDLYLL